VATETQPNHRLLRLREVDAEEIAASLRDTALDGAESQRAALGLARALMEAGYARVQVVVNGVLERQADSPPPMPNATAVSEHARARPSSTSSPESHHGH
jgi:hypothetical protein